MFDRLFRRKKRLADAFRDEIGNTIDFDNAAQRTGAALFLILDKQLKLLGLQSGSVPLDDRLASDQCCGALMGTAFYLVRDQYAQPMAKDYIDATIAAFTIVFGEHVGRGRALATIQASSDGNETITSASDWAAEDTKAWNDDGPATPMAYYLAATGMI